MNWIVTPYVLLLFIPVVPLLAVAALVLQRRDKPGGLPLGLLLIAAAVWSLTAAMEAAATTIPAKVLWSQLSYFGIYGTPFFLILFTLEFTWQRKQLDRRYVIALGIIPLILILLAFTNSYHGLIWSDYIPVPGSNRMIYEHGIGFWFGVVYAYTVLAVSAYLLIRQAFRFRHVYREQSLIIVLSILPPWLANAIYVLELDPVPGREFTSLAFALTALILVWGVRRLHLLDLSPIARDWIIEEMRAGVLVLDEQGRVADANPAASRLTGLARRDMLGHTAAALLADWGLELHSLWNGEERRVETTLADGRYVACRLWSLPHPGALPSGQLLLLQNITPQKEAQEALRTLNASLEAKVAARTAEIRAEKEQRDAILRSVGDGILMLDGDLMIQYTNPAFTALSGYRPADLLNRPVTDFISEENAARLKHRVEPVLKQGEMWQGDVRTRRKDGRFYDASLTVAPLWDGAGEPTGYVCTLHDVTRRKQLERTRTQLLQNISHQLRTPLTTLALYVELSRRADLSEQLRHNFQVMEAQIEWLSQIIQSTVEMATLESGEATARWEPVDPVQLVSYAVGRHRGRAEEKGVRLRIGSFSPSLPAIQGDPERLVQAVAELVKNGVVFTPQGGEVVVKGEEKVGRNGRVGLAITLEDDGPGIPADEQAQIFTHFYRGTAAQAGDIPGAGLGLSIAQTIAQAHGGYITLESDETGSVFHLWLPGEMVPEATQLDAHPQR